MGSLIKELLRLDAFKLPVVDQLLIWLLTRAADVRVWHFASAPKPKIHVRFWSASHKRATASSGVLPEPMHQVLVADHSWSLSLREERSRNLSGPMQTPPL
jgi:hypothetical protein